MQNFWNGALGFFQNDARKKWPLKGSKHADNLMSKYIGFRCQGNELLDTETWHPTPETCIYWQHVEKTARKVYQELTEIKALL